MQDPRLHEACQHRPYAKPSVPQDRPELPRKRDLQVDPFPFRAAPKTHELIGAASSLQQKRFGQAGAIHPVHRANLH